MIKFLLLFLLSLSSIHASCKEYMLLGSQQQNQLHVDLKKSMIWSQEHGIWTLLQPQKSLYLTDALCKESGYILLDKNNINNKRVLYHHNYYDLKKGWNTLSTPKEGLDVKKTFLDVEFVYVYDQHSKTWAGYSPKSELMQKMQSSGILELKYIEPHKKFYLLSQKAMRVPIASKVPNEACQKIIKSNNYELLENSGASQQMSYSSRKTVAFASRYLSHQRKGIYNDSRVLLMIPKLNSFAKDRDFKKYGPALPKIKIAFNAAYIGREFYAYDYLNESCYKGYFPSKKRPPAPVLEKLQ